MVSHTKNFESWSYAERSPPPHCLAEAAQAQEEVEYMGPLVCLLGMAALRKHASISITHPHLDQNLLLKELEYLQWEPLGIKALIHMAIFPQV